ncbi:RNB domain-containing ribonuclease [Pelolinea submarina]|uniref:Exoribonuclease-2 n=1 Tax=Pelolinea submarina TaxID=913107 RepID=A0A347ZTM0_9CHLR|nr:RNB domain-containing ribonuclease [Pelolinea submarina]REG10771.1 exoribonuclease-2 [Pelolinea submarina]BBB48651.1 exoribonuclease II [Pelolinea submarina]
MDQHIEQHREILERIAYAAMLERGLLPEFSKEDLAELERIEAPAHDSGDSLVDLTDLLWVSIDNDDSLDLDQTTTAEEMPEGRAKIYVAVADVDALVKKGTKLDGHAQHNTTSVYTAAKIFPMLPEKLSTNLTSLNYDADRVSMVIEMIINPDGSLLKGSVYRALTHNYAKLAYNSMAAWLEGNGPIPEEVAAVDGLAANLRLQDATAQLMKKFRHEHGALSLETIEAKAVFSDGQVESLEKEERNRAKDLIENFMVTANGVTARFLEENHFPSLRRVVRVPKRWERIVKIAAEHHYDLPKTPNSKALEVFLIKQKEEDPEPFPDLSLTIIKLMGAGEYMAEMPQGAVPGHFGLAVKDYAHSTAPNRRYPDLITHRLLKAALHDEPVPYTNAELQELAAHCTEAEDAANKVERQVGKSAAALLLKSHIGEKYEGIVTGAAQKGTWVRLLKIPVEGKLVQGTQGVDVGDRIHVQLIDVNVEKGYIDFKRIKSSRR